MLNSENDGFIVNTIHNRAGCYVYMKEIRNGVCEDAPLAEEERISLEMALNYGQENQENTEETVEE